MHGLRRIGNTSVSMELLLLFFLLVFVLPIWLVFRARRRAEEAAEKFQHDAAAGGDIGSPSFFDLFMGPGMSSRSYEIDPETGEWVDVTDRMAEHPPSPSRRSPSRSGRSGSAGRGRARRRIR
jgi:hypothetical protein